MSLNDALLNAIGRYGPLVNHLAESRYGISGEALLAKLIQGESGGQATARSPAGAYGYTQFMPATRQTAVQKYGVDPYAGAGQAVHAATLHLLGKLTGSTGLEGYNPGGGQSYVNYILGQKVGAFGGARPGAQSSAGSQSTLSGTVTPGAVSGGAFSPGTVPDASLLAGLQQQPQQAYQTPMPVTQGLKNLRLAVQSPQVAAMPQPSSSGGDLSSLLASASQDLPSAGVGAPKVQITRGQQQAASGGQSAQGRLQLPASFKPTHQTSGLPGYPAIDVFGKPGTSVGAPISGRVIKLSGRDPSAGAYEGQGGPFGYSVYISDGRRTYFLTHLGSRDVHVGQRISRGQVIGTVGNYPGATPDHIHVGLSQH